MSNFYVKFSDFKKDNLAVASLFEDAGFYDRAQNIESCASHLLFGNRVDGSHELIHGNFCKDRFCPLCQARRSAQRAMELLHVLDRLSGEFLLLTLTVVNVTGDQLRSKIEFMTDQFRYFMKDPRIKKGVCGYIRNLEVTYNKDLDTYHPHFHVLINVSDSYFVDHSQYLSRSDVLDVWRAYMHDDRIIDVDIRKVRGKQLDRAVVETTKYFTKFKDWVHEDNASSVLYYLTSSLKSVNCTTMGGSIRKAILQLRSEREAEKIPFNEKILSFIQNANSAYSSLDIFDFQKNNYSKDTLDLPSNNLIRFLESHPFYQRIFQYQIYAAQLCEYNNFLERKLGMIG